MKNIIIQVIKWTLTIGLVWFAISSIEDQTSNLGTQFWNRTLAMNWWWIFAAFIVLNLSFLLSTIQWWFLLRRQNIVFALSKCLRLYYVGLFFNNFMPGNTGGDIKKIYDVNKDSKQLAASVTATLADRIFGLFALNLYCLVIGLIFFRNTPKLNSILIPSFWIFIVMVLLFCAFYSRRLSSQIENILDQFKLNFISKKFNSLRLSFQKYKSMMFWFKISGIALSTQALRIYVYYFIALSLGIHTDQIYFFYLIPIIGIVSALPISVGGFGPREVLTQTLFAMCLVSPLNSLLMQIWAVIIFTLVSLWGGLDFLLFRKKASPQ